MGWGQLGTCPEEPRKWRCRVGEATHPPAFATMIYLSTTQSHLPVCLSQPPTHLISIMSCPVQPSYWFSLSLYTCTTTPLPTFYPPSTHPPSHLSPYNIHFTFSFLQSITRTVFLTCHTYSLPHVLLRPFHAFVLSSYTWVLPYTCSYTCLLSFNHLFSLSIILVIDLLCFSSTPFHSSHTHAYIPCVTSPIHVFPTHPSTILPFPHLSFYLTCI